jgi:hypothetical protein
MGSMQRIKRKKSRRVSQRGDLAEDYHTFFSYYIFNIMPELSQCRNTHFQLKAVLNYLIIFLVAEAVFTTYIPGLRALMSMRVPSDAMSFLPWAS